MKQIKNILFDLDGTLTDPAEGITRCIQYSLERLGMTCPPIANLYSYIGPPLRQTFEVLCESSDGAVIEEAVALFRERFASVGLFENSVYEGVPEMLGTGQSCGYSLFVATSKPTAYAERILEHFSLSASFVRVHGNDLDGRLDDKADLIGELIAEHGLNPAETIMVGDRKHDVIAAKRHGVFTIGVTYGYGSAEELNSAGADLLCHSPRDVAEQIGRGKVLG